MVCPTCQRAVPAEATFCPSCGNRLRAGPMDARCAIHRDTPAVATCARCGSFACRTCATTLPDGTVVCEVCKTREQGGIPWDRREELGTVKAWWKTSLLVVQKPTAAFAAARPDAPMGSSVLFAVLSSLAGMLTTVLLYAAIIGGALMIAAAEGKNPDLEGWNPGLVGLATLGGIAAYLALVAVGSVMQLFIVSGLEHLSLRLVGAQPNAFEVTVRGHALAMGPYVVGLVPICGLYAFPIWSMVLRVFAYRQMHQTTTGKAVGGVLLPIGAFFGLAIVGYVIAVLVAVAA